MNILVVSSYLPYPLHSGGHVRLYNLLKRLSKKHTITLVCERRKFQTADDEREIKKLCTAVYTFPRKKQWTPANILKASTSGSHSFLIVGHTLPDMKEKIAGLLKKQQFDIIHVETSYVFQNLPETVVPTVLTEHNLEYAVYKKYLTIVPRWVARVLSVDIKKLEKEEKSFWKKAEKVVVVSEHEKKEVEKTVKDVAVVPNGVDIKVFQPKSLSGVYNGEKRLLYIGHYKWIQNQTALRWILSDIWPSIEKQTDESVKLWIVGRDLPDEFKKYKSSRVILEGMSKKPAHELFSASFALLAPLNVAGGTQYKILESMAVGTPVITTKLGSVGLNIGSDKMLLASDTAEGVVKDTLKLLKDEELYKTLSKNSRKHIEENFSFDAIAEKLDSVYHQVVSGK